MIKPEHYCIIFILLSTLVGCTTGLSIATTGMQAFYNRHNLQKTFTDRYITIQAYREIYHETDRYVDSNISITTFNNIVLLTGEIPSNEKRREVEKLVKNIGGVDRVYNFTTVSPPSSHLTRVSDSWITAKIKAKFVANDDIDPSGIKVITENGTVYLLGVVLPDQAITAVQIARSTTGVQNVVKVLYYLRLSKT